MPTKYETLDHQRIIERYKEKSLRDLAIEFGVSGGLITKVLKSYNVPRRSVGGRFNQKGGMHTDAKLKANVKRLYWDEALSLAECGKRLGISGGYVSQLMKRWGIPSRKATRKPINKVEIAADKVVRLYTVKYLTVAEIAMRNNVSKTVINKVLESEGVSRRTPAERKVLIEKLRNADKSPKTVLVVPDLPDTSIADQILILREQQNAKIQDIAAALDMLTVDVFHVIRGAGVL